MNFNTLDRYLLLVFDALVRMPRGMDPSALAMAMAL